MKINTIIENRISISLNENEMRSLIVEIKMLKPAINEKIKCSILSVIYDNWVNKDYLKEVP